MLQKLISIGNFMSPLEGKFSEKKSNICEFLFSSLCTVLILMSLVSLTAFLHGKYQARPDAARKARMRRNWTGPSAPLIMVIERGKGKAEEERKMRSRLQKADRYMAMKRIRELREREEKGGDYRDYLAAKRNKTLTGA